MSELLILLYALGGIVLLAIIVGVGYGLVTGGWKKQQMPPERKEALVELRSGALLAFDFPSEGVRYEIPDFSPGFYLVPIDAVREATEDDPPQGPDGAILVDMAVIMLVDADFADKLREIEERLFEEINATPSVIHRYNDVVRELGIRFDYLDLDGDGAYLLDVSRIAKASDHEGDADR